MRQLGLVLRACETHGEGMCRVGVCGSEGLIAAQTFGTKSRLALSLISISSAVGSLLSLPWNARLSHRLSTDGSLSPQSYVPPGSLVDIDGFVVLVTLPTKVFIVGSEQIKASGTWISKHNQLLPRSDTAASAIGSVGRHSSLPHAVTVVLIIPAFLLYLGI
jgi:hypothetical protein